MDQLNSNTDIISRKRGKHLSLDERGAIQALHRQGQSREFDTCKTKKCPQSLEIGLFFCQNFFLYVAYCCVLCYN